MAVYRRVCVIGGGLAGLGAIKICLDEGLEPTCYEMQEDIGGLWRFKDDDIEGRGCVMKSTIINTSKEMSSVSNLIFPEHFPNYMHNSELIKVFDEYADRFNLKKYIYFKHRVVEVDKTEDYTKTGRWKVKVHDLQNDTLSEDIYDAVLVCTGHHVYPLEPKFLGQEKFKGRILHSHSYKSSKGFENRRVVVVGAGNSAVDAATDVCYVTTKVILSTRTGLWLTPRVGLFGLPSDIFYLTRFINFLFNHLPWNITNYFCEAMANMRMNHEVYGLKPKHRYLEQHPTLNDALPDRLLSGHILIKGNIKEFTENGIIFEKENFETPVDDVILCTGYKVHFPFLNFKFEDNKVELYKLIFPPDNAYPTLAFIGLFQPLGPGFPPGELQLRWVARILSGQDTLPPSEEMWKDIKAYTQKTRKIFGPSPCHTLHVYYINYMDEIAKLVGCKPNLLKMFFTDPILFFYCFFGPCLPYQFRLQGPGTWAGARNAILTYKKRVYAPLKSSRIITKKSRNFVKLILMILPIIVFLVWCLVF